MVKQVENWGANRKWNENVKRAVLADAVPLSTPYVAYIDPANACNFSCKFCPTGHPELLRRIKRPTGVMDFNLFKKIINDFKLFPEKLRVLFLHKDGEPLLNPRLGDMMALAKHSEIAPVVWLTTNGALITRERAIEIIESGIDYVRLSVEHVTAEGYRDFTKTYSNYDGLRRNIDFLFNEKNRRGSHLKIWAKMIDFNFTEDELKKFGEDFGGIADEVLLTGTGVWTDQMGIDFNLGANPQAGYDGATPMKKNRIVCPYTFYNIAINFDGTTGGCMLDWSHSLVTGDARIQSIVDIWTSPAMNRVRLAHLEGRRKEFLSCNGCQCVQFMPADNELDDVREKLIPMFKDEGKS